LINKYIKNTYKFFYSSIINNYLSILELILNMGIAFYWMFFPFEFCHFIENYMGLNKFIFVFIFLSLMSRTQGQNNSVKVYSAENMKILRVNKTFTKFSQENVDGVNWDLSSDILKLELDSNQKSKPLILSDFNLALEPIRKIISFKLVIKNQNYSNLTGLNKIQVKLFDSSKLIYKTTKKITGFQLKPIVLNIPKEFYDRINSDKLKVSIVLENGREKTIFDIGEISLLLDYESIFHACKNDLLTFYIDELGSGFRYEWNVPSDAIITSDDNKNIINIILNDNNYGDKNISVSCISPTDTLNGETKFIYKDCSLSCLSGQVLIDDNCNDSFDLTDNGVDSLRVLLYKGLIFYTSAYTDSLGYFNFDEIESDFYNIIINDKRDFDVINSNIARISVENRGNSIISDEFYIEPGNCLDSFNILVDRKLSCDLILWEDLNENDLFDSSEIVDIRQTNALLFNDYGNYNIKYSEEKYYVENLSMGDYTFCIDKSSDFYLANSFDSNCVDISIDCLDSARVQYFEVLRKGAISGEIWLDKNKDGIKDNVEDRLSSIEVELLDTLGNALAVANTDAAGKYSFVNLRINDYILNVHFPDSLDLTGYGIGDKSHNSDFKNNKDLFTSDILNISSGSYIKDVDCGLVYRHCSVGDYVWFDKNENGIQDYDETGIDGIEIKLFSDKGVYKSMITNSNGSIKGYYKFDSLDYGNYYIEVVVPNEYKITKSKIGDELHDSDVVDGEVRTSGFTLLAGETKTDIDIGLIHNYSSLSIMTWFDKIENNIKDIYESGIDSLEFELFDENGTFLRRNTSKKIFGVKGICEFDSLIEGNYLIKLNEFDKKYKLVDFEVGINRNLDSDFHDVNGDFQSENIFVKGGQNINDIGLGFGLNYSSITGMVWEDRNNDGIIDTEERGVSGILIELYNDAGDKLRTIHSNSMDSIGKYEFKGLQAGKYYVKFINSDLYDLSDGQGIDNAITGDFGRGTSSIIDIGWGQNVLDINGGFVNNKSSIGDYVWLDENENGVQDNDETGVENILIYLLDDNDLIIDSTFSDNRGKYIFSNIEEGQYRIKVSIDKKYKYTIYSQSDDFGSIINGAVGDGYSELFSIVRGKDLLNKDIGLVYNYSSIGDEVWFDANNNGIKETGESGVGAVLLLLVDKKGEVIDSSYTDDEGNYNFEKVISSDYFIQLIIPDTLQLIKDSFAYPVTDANGLNTTSVFSVLPGIKIEDADFGLNLKKAVIGDYIWLDSNENGLQDINESGLNGIVVLLYNDYGEEIGATISTVHEGRNGYYSFEVDRGIYFMQFIGGDSLEATKIVDEQQEANSDISNSLDVNSTDWFEIAPGEIRDDFDAGFKYKTVTIGGRLWYDTNGDGILQKTEAGANGAIVKLYDRTGIIESTTTYSSNVGNGFYIFKGIKRGNYYVEFEYPDDYANTVPLNSLNPKRMSFVTNSNGHGTTDLIEFEAGTRDLFINGGYVLRTENFIGDYIWNDVNENGIQEVNEEGINDVKVSLYNANDSLIRVTQSKEFPGSDKKGYYKFTNIQVGDYYLKFSLKIGQTFTKSKVSDHKKDSDVILATGETSIFHLGKLDKLDDMDAGIVFISHGSIGDFVWEDMNGNSIQDIGEPGINGVKIKLYRAKDDLLLQTQLSHTNNKTGDNGYYLFDNLPNRDYYIKIEMPKDYILVRSGIGGDTEKDSDIESLITLKTGIIELKFKEKRHDIDIGLNRHAVVTGKVWLDDNENGIQDIGEQGVSNVNLFLIQENNKNNYPAVSSDSGVYSFNKVQPGNYILNVIIPAGYFLTLADLGDDSKDSDIVNSDGTSAIYTMKSGTLTDNLDVGLIKNNTFNAISYPNPALKDLSLEFEMGRSDSEIKVIISTVKGNIIKSETFSSKIGVNRLSFDIQNLNQGYYNLIIFVDGKIKIVKYFMKSDK